MSSTRVMIIGLDAATLDLVRPWVESGELPFIGQLMREGTSGTLLSTIIPSSLPAWSSFATGKNPGKQGLVAFWREGSRRKYFNSADLGAATMWDILSRASTKCIVVNVPGTYPPKPINGLIVTGMLTPGIEASYTYPPELKDVIQEKIPDYRIDFDHNRKIGQQRLEDISYVTQKREELAQFLKSQYDWDLFVVVFTGTDRIQHNFWNEKNTIGLQFFKTIDRYVAGLAGDLEDGVQLIIVSDHGFTTCDKALRMNAWLQKHGYLNTRFLRKEETASRGAVLQQLPQVLRKHSEKELRAAGRGLSIGNMFKKRKKVIDWSRTRAYCYGGPVSGMNIHLAGRDPGGIVQPGDEYERLRDEIIAKLREFTDPETGRKVFREVMKKEEVWSGDFMDCLPDILMLMSSQNYLFKSSVNKRQVVRRYKRARRGKKGWHAREGMILMKGSLIKRGKTVTAELIDVAPTVIHLLGHPVPNDMDGKVLTEALAERFLTEQPVEYCEPLTLQTAAEPEAARQEWEIAIERRLKGLGYM